MSIQHILAITAAVVAALVTATPAVAGPTEWLIETGSAVRRQLDSARPRVFRRSVNLENASLDTFKNRLGWFGIELPVELDGDITASLAAEVDLTALGHARSYHLEGSLSSNRLVVEGLELRSLTARARFTEGRVALDELVFQLPDPRATEPPGRVAGQATLQLIPAGALNATLELDVVPLEPLSRRIEAAESLTGGRLTGRLRADAPVGQLREVAAWKAAGEVTLVDLIAAKRSISRAATSFRVTDGVLTLTDFTASIEGERIAGNGTLNLAAPFSYRASLSVPDGQLDRIARLSNRPLPGQWIGDYDLDANASGQLRPFLIDATATISGTNWRVDGIPIDSINAKVVSDGKSLNLSNLTVAAGRGQLTGEGRIRRRQEQTGFSFKIEAHRFDVAALGPVISVAQQPERGAVESVAFQTPDSDADAPPSDPNLAGKATGEIKVEGGLPFRLDAIDGSLSFENLTLGGATFDRAEIVATTENRTLVLTRLLLVRGNDELTGQGRLALDAPGDISATLRSEHFSIDPTKPLFGEGGVAPVDLPSISGTVAIDVAVAGQLQPFGLDSLNGNLSGEDVRIGRLLIDRIEANAATTDQSITVSNVLLVVDGGHLTGEAVLGTAGERHFEATLRPERFRVELLRPLFGEDGLIETDFPPIAGSVTGEITVRGQAASAEVEDVSGRISAEEGSIYGVRFQKANVEITSDDGTAHFSDLVAVSDFGRLNGRASLRLTEPFDYIADLAFDQFDLASLGAIAAGLTEEQLPDIESPAEVSPGPGVLPIELEGLADVTGNLRGTLVPLVLTGDGLVQSERLVLDANQISALFKAAELTTPRFNWRYNERRLILDEIEAGLAGGRLGGSAAAPLGDAAAGSLDLQVNDVALGDLLELPAGINGVAIGRITAKLSPVNREGDREASGSARLAIPTLRAGRVSIGSVHAEFSLERDVLGYEISGRLLDGPITANGTAALKPKARHAASGTILWEGGNLARAAVAFDTDASLAGRLDAAIEYDLAAPTKATGRFEASAVRYDNRLLTDRFMAQLVWTDSLIRIEHTGGSYAGGVISLTADLNPLDYSRGTVEVTLRGADAARGVGWIPGLEPLEGRLDLRLSGRLVDLWRWRGDAQVSGGNYGPLAFSSARIPLIIDAHPLRGVIRVDVRRGNLRAAHGRGVLNVSADLGLSRRLNVDLTFNEMDAEQVIGGDELGKRVSGGRVSGRLELSSRNFRSLADLDGSLVATISGSRAASLPVIGSIVDVARLPAGGGGVVDRGELRVLIRQGIARIQGASIAGRSFRMYAEGTVALASRRLALDAVVDTRPARTDRLIAGFLLRQFVDFGSPVGWLAQANRFVAERAIFLRVTGTLERPIVRVRPVEQLGQEALRFLLNEIAGPAGGSQALPEP